MMRINGLVSVLIGRDKVPTLGKLIRVDIRKGIGVVCLVRANMEVERDLKRIYPKELAEQHALKKYRKPNG